MRFVGARSRTVVHAAVAVALVATIAAAPTDVAGTVHVARRPLADAVVWIEAPAPAPPVPARVVLDQRNLTFSPHVLPVRVGTVVELPNNDRVFHNVFSFHDGKKFDLGLYPTGSSKRLTFDRPGLSRIFCNIHPGMAAYILAVDSPYFAVSDRQGRFAIRGVPPGHHTYRAWRPGGDIISGTVTVGEDAALQVQWP
jgi:plastocyanin